MLEGLIIWLPGANYKLLRAAVGYLGVCISVLGLVEKIFHGLFLQVTPNLGLTFNKTMIFSVLHNKIYKFYELHAREEQHIFRHIQIHI